jgi:hypothetical protein
MLSVPCHPVGSRDARKGRLYTWRQASPPSGARHHPGAYQAGRYHPGRPGQDARKGRLYISFEAVTQKCRDAPCGRLPAVEVSGARHNPAAYQAGRYHLA